MVAPDEWRTCLAQLKRTDIDREIFWRSVPEAFKQTPLEWSPSFLDGNRYNPKDEFAALYFSACEELAEKEAEGKSKGKFLEPRVRLRFRMQIRNVIDLTDEQNLSALRDSLDIAKEDLMQAAGPTEAGYKTTRLLGRTAYELEVTGLRVLSSKENEMKVAQWNNLVLFPAKLLTPFVAPA